MSYKKYIADATIVNAQDNWNDKKFLVGVWQGSGYLMDLFVVCAPDAEDVLDILANYFIKNGISRFFVNIDGLSEDEIETAEGYGDIIYTEHGYLYGENLSIEEL